MNPAHRAPASFRDPAGAVFLSGQRVIRAIDREEGRDWVGFTSPSLLRSMEEQGLVIRSIPLDTEASRALPSDGAPRYAVEHPRIPFVSYPYEWSFSMLRDAALLHLEILRQGLRQGHSTKDGSSYNVQFEGVRPILIDTLSIVRRDSREPWEGYEEFCRSFLNPLLLSAHKGIAFNPWLRGRLRGLTAHEVRPLFGVSDLLKPGVFVHVWLQALLQQRMASKRTSWRESPLARRAPEGVALRVVESLVGVVRSLRYRSSSAWTGYEQSRQYSAADLELKSSFVVETAAAIRPSLVWDLGANLAEFSLAVAPYARFVVAMDADPASVDRAYARIQAAGVTNVLPLVVDVLDASPHQGWRLTERAGLLERGRPDLGLALGLLHHLVIGAGVPLQEVADWMAVTADQWIVELADRDDPMVRLLMVNKRSSHPYSLTEFETAFQRRFEVKRRLSLPMQTRTLMHLQVR